MWSLTKQEHFAHGPAQMPAPTDEDVVVDNDRITSQPIGTVIAP